MSLFNSILEKLGIGSSTAAEAPVAGQPAPASASAAAIPVVDVVTKLEGLAASQCRKAYWNFHRRFVSYSAYFALLVKNENHRPRRTQRT